MPQYKRIGIFLQPPFSKTGTPSRRKPTGPGAAKILPRGAGERTLLIFYILPEICKLSALRRHFLKGPGRGQDPPRDAGKSKAKARKKPDGRLIARLFAYGMFHVEQRQLYSFLRVFRDVFYPAVQAPRNASSAAPMSAVTAMERARISSGTLCGRSLTSAYTASGFWSVRIWNGYLMMPGVLEPTPSSR